MLIINKINIAYIFISVNNKESKDYGNSCIAFLDLLNGHLDTKIVIVSVLEAKIEKIQ